MSERAWIAQEARNGNGRYWVFWTHDRNQRVGYVEANAAEAHLMAAAPEMLDALQAAQRALFETGASGQSSALFKKICAAINKAEGK